MREATSGKLVASIVQFPVRENMLRQPHGIPLGVFFQATEEEMVHACVILLLAFQVGWQFAPLRGSDPAEMLEVENDTLAPMYVTARNSQRGAQWPPWQRVEPLVFKQFALFGSVPVDIAIYQDGRYTMFYNQDLHSIMKKCEQTGKTDWNLKASGGYRVGGPNGPYIQDPLMDRKIHVDVDGYRVRIPYERFAGNVPEEPRPPKRPY